MREHWAKKAKRAASHRSVARLAVGAALRARGVHGTAFWPIRVTLTRVASRCLDPGNCEGSFKHVQDGTADALGVDDGDRAKVSWVYNQRKAPPKTYAVEILIEWMALP
jgi:hypothetical protein